MKQFAYITLIIMAIASSIMLSGDVSNYISSYKSLRGLKLNITDLKVFDDENPRVLIDFKVKNRSPFTVDLRGYWFDLYLGGEIVGRSYSSYRGTNPKADSGVSTKAQAINQNLGPGETLDLAFTLYIYSTNMEIVRKTIPTAPMIWHVRSDFNVYLPYARKISHARLKADYEG